MPSPPLRLDPDLDARLVARCLQGDRRAWEVLVRRHERLVYAVTRSYRLAEGDAADAFQEVFAALARGLPSIRDGRALVRWLASTADRIARAAALRLRRAAARHDPAGTEALAGLAAPAAEAGLAVEELERQALVRMAMAALPARCRELLTALYYEDPAPAYAELARRLQMPVGSLGPTRARCFERMRALVLRLDPEAPRISTGESATSTAEESPPGGARRSHPYGSEPAWEARR